MRHTALIAALLTTVPAAALAQEAPPAPAPAAPQDGDDFHTTEDIVVTAPFVRSLDLFGTVGIIEGDDLARDLRPQIGEALTREPGVSATSFSPGASRPVVRGFQGERVRVLTDGIGSIDVSNTSADHGVTIDPLTAERIEVLRGAASLLFGSNAIGGAINIFDRRIPRRVPDEPVHVDAIATYGSAADERSGGASLDVALAPTIALHIDGSYTRTDDLRIGGYQLAPGLRAEVADAAAEERAEGHSDIADALDAAAARTGFIPNSAVESYALGSGIALITDGGSLGVSVGYYDSRYGVPERPGAGHAHEGGAEEELPAPVSIDLRQWRADVRGELALGGGFFDRLRIRAGYADYQHTEFEGDEVGTTFYNQGVEARAELVQADRGGWRGATGFQYMFRDFNAVGAEAFVPQNDSEQFALFSLQEIAFGPASLEFSGRYEHSRVEAQARGFARSFDALSGAVGLTYELATGSKLGLTLARTARAPSPEELLSDGPHVATQAYERGDEQFGIERAWSIEGFARLDLGGVNLSLTSYHSWFSNFIYADATGEEEDGLPVFAYRQGDVRHYGFEAEASARLAQIGRFDIRADVVADYTRARLVGGGNLPRIPPLRILGGLEADSDRLTARVEAEHVFAQNRIAAVETATDAFTLVNASLSWKPVGDGVSLILSANNLFDVDARRHASFTKDFVPLAGRDLRVTARFSF